MGDLWRDDPEKQGKYALSHSCTAVPRENTLKERRKFPRYVVEEETALFTEPKIVLSDSLVDVSQGGLAFNYEDKKPFNTGVLVRMDIIRDDVTILNIPVKIISDIETPNPAEFSRRCGNLLDDRLHISQR